MFNVGDMVQGYIYNDQDEEVLVVGAFMCYTDDPEEMYQDVIVRTSDGRTVYLDGQEARPYNPRGQAWVGSLNDGVPNYFDQNSRNFQPK